MNLFACFVAFYGIGGQNYASYYHYQYPYNPYTYPAPVTSFTMAQTTSTVPTTTTSANSNTAPGGAPPGKVYFGVDGSVCDTRTAFTFIGCPCMIVGKQCADINSICSVPSNGRKKRFAARSRSRSSIGGSTCVCKPSYAYDPKSKICLASMCDVRESFVILQYTGLISFLGAEIRQQFFRRASLLQFYSCGDGARRESLSFSFRSLAVVKQLKIG